MTEETLEPVDTGTDLEERIQELTAENRRLRKQIKRMREAAAASKKVEFSKIILVMLMFSGACAGSTGGGMKVSRLVIMLKFPMLLLINPYTWKEIKIRKNKKNKKEGHSI